jgi:hypothetical protein
MKVAILLNKSHSKFRITAKKVLHNVYSRSLARSLVLPEFDSFAEVLDPNPLILGTEESIPWDRLSNCNLLIWEWGWDSVAPEYALSIRKRVPQIKIIVFAGPLDRFWRKLNYQHFELHMRAARASDAIGVMLRDMQPFYEALVPHSHVFHMPVPVDTRTLAIRPADSTGDLVFLGAPLRFTGVDTQLPISTFLAFRLLMESDSRWKGICFAYAREEKAEATEILSRLQIAGSVQIQTYMRPLLRFLKTMAQCRIGLHLPHSFVQGRLAMMGASLGLPMVLSNDAETHTYLYPETTVRWYETAKAAELAQRLLIDDAFRHRVVHVARERLTYYSVDQCAQRIRNALEVISRNSPAKASL